MTQARKILSRNSVTWALIKFQGLAPGAERQEDASRDAETLLGSAKEASVMQCLREAE